MMPVEREKEKEKEEKNCVAHLCYGVSLYHFRVNPGDVFGAGVSD